VAFSRAGRVEVSQAGDGAPAGALLSHPQF
jgi:hypothetical protein